jgi:Fur family ferric uptake transcriptional regulator
MIDVECVVGAAPCLAAVDARGFEIDEAEVAYWGRCPECVVRARVTEAVATDTRRPRPTARAGRVTSRAARRGETPTA